MLYLYYGEDLDSARAKVQATITSMLAKNPDALYFRVTSDVLDDYNFDELTGSQALFKSEYVVLLDTLFSQKEGEEAVLQNIEKIADSAHPFFLLEGKLTAVLRKKLEKHATKVFTFDTTVERKAAPFNTFSLTDALGERNVKKLWTLFREAKHSGVSDEEIHGILFWMFKSLLLAQGSSTPEAAGMKAYPFDKAKRFVKKFGTRELLEKKIMTFALLPQQARRSGTSLEILLEQFILTL
ncbi:hypothetical protein COB18_02900 [Candidatus Kaiserbacteria bacterium]|nr:MAG: hypothetical protein COB18_02900 [Candidatus Kaiserbacteria bacterium]